MSERRWGDSSDEESDDDNMVPMVHRKEAKGTQSTEADAVHALRPQEEQNVDTKENHSKELHDDPHIPDGAEEEDESDDKNVSEEDDSSEDDSEEDEEERQRRIDAAKEAAAKKKAKQQAKKVNVDDQLDNLDDILNEFGIETPEQVKDNNTKDVNEEIAPSLVSKTTSNRTSKKKKSKKKKGGTANVSNEPADVPTVIDPDAAAKVLKAKLAGSKTKKPKSAAQSAAAVAAKEMKSSGDKKKKKKTKQPQNYDR